MRWPGCARRAGGSDGGRPTGSGSGLVGDSSRTRASRRRFGGLPASEPQGSRYAPSLPRSPTRACLPGAGGRSRRRRSTGSCAAGKLSRTPLRSEGLQAGCRPLSSALCCRPRWSAASPTSASTALPGSPARITWGRPGHRPLHARRGAGRVHDVAGGGGGGQISAGHGDTRGLDRVPGVKQNEGPVTTSGDNAPGMRSRALLASNMETEI
jgi:hypothetical protein